MNRLWVWFNEDDREVFLRVQEVSGAAVVRYLRVLVERGQWQPTR